jgi:hypothetical protein
VAIANSPINLDAIGTTPDRIPGAGEKTTVTREEALHLLYSCLLGEPFAWSSIQNGHVINEVLPVQDNATRPMSSGSRSVFDLHTEDAFHPHMGDHFGLMCLRNPDATPTLMTSIDDLTLSASIKRILFEPRFIIGANVAHDVAQVARRSAILFGAFDRPYMRINMNVDPQLAGDSPAQAAFDALTDQLRRHVSELALRPGDCVYADNFRVAHGRPAFLPSYDGRDRWLKRVYITSYLRQSRALRAGPESRLIRTEPQDHVH